MFTLLRLVKQKNILQVNRTKCIHVEKSLRMCFIRAHDMYRLRIECDEKCVWDDDSYGSDLN